ncbi:MAG: cell division topological specificity factor MinE [Halanaerobiaceae bacterium]
MRGRGSAIDFILKKLGLREEKEEHSKNIAKERLQFILVQDRIKLTPEELDSLKGELIGVLKKYVEVDDRNIEMDINREDDVMALVASFPLKNKSQGR